MTKISTAVLAALAVTLIFASVAPAQSSLDGYSDVGGNVQDQVDQPNEDEPTDDVAGTQASGDDDEPDESGDVQSSSGESLPFTGLDVALLVGAGALLLALGLGMRRLTRASA